MLVSAWLSSLQHSSPSKRYSSFLYNRSCYIRIICVTVSARDSHRICTCNRCQRNGCWITYDLYHVPEEVWNLGNLCDLLKAISYSWKGQIPDCEPHSDPPQATSVSYHVWRLHKWGQRRQLGNSCFIC